MKGHHQWDVQLVLEFMPRETTHPVVGVNDVGLTIFAKERGNRAGEDWNIGEQLLSRNFVRWTRRDVVNPKARFNVHNVGFTNV